MDLAAADAMSQQRAAITLATALPWVDHCYAALGVQSCLVVPTEARYFTIRVNSRDGESSWASTSN